MKKEVVRFYQDKGIPIPLLISKSKDLQPDQVEAGAVKVFNEIQNGLEIKQQDIPRYVWKKARGIDSEKYKRDRLLIFNYTNKVRKLAGQYKYHKKKSEHDRERLDWLERLSSCLVWMVFVYFFYYKFIFLSLY